METNIKSDLREKDCENGRQTQQKEK